MADKKPAAPAKDAKGGKPVKKGNSAVTLVMMICVILAILAPSACIIIPGMLPAIIALIGDRDREKAAGITVGAMNAAGVAPVVMELWKQGHSFGAAFGLLADPTNWLIMYGASAVGSGIYYIVPSVIAGLMAAHAEGRLKILRTNQETLRKLWGNEVAGNLDQKR